MAYSIQLARSVFFIVQMYVAMFVMALYYTPLAVINLFGRIAGFTVIAVTCAGPHLG